MTEQGRGGLPPLAGSRMLPRDVDRRRQVVAAAWIAGFLALVLLVWVAVVAGGNDTDRGDAPEAGADSVDPSERTSSPTDGDTEAPTDGDTEGQEAPTDGDAEAQDRTTAPTDGDVAADEEGSDDEDAGDEVSTLTFDGACTVEVPADEVRDDPRPWDHDACVHAPVALESGDERWIVVRASLPADGFDAAAASRRATAIGDDADLLWSSHYPSLNPGLWVVFAGPYPDADAARQAADSMGGGAYPRALAEN